MTDHLRAFLHEDKPFLGLYSWGWVIMAGIVSFVLVLAFGPPAWLAAVVWRLFAALVVGASIIAVLFALGIVLILTCGYSK